MWFTSCPLIYRSKFYLFWFYCPPPWRLNIWAFRFFNISLAECRGFCNSFWQLWLRTLPNILFIWLCTKYLYYGVFMRFTILRRRWIGSPVHGPILWTTHLCADLSWFP